MTHALLGEALLAITAIYPLVAIAAIRSRRHRSRIERSDEAPVPVTVLKPLCGIEPRLYENLRSFCEQDVEEYQIVFGARHAGDPALAIARRLQSELPHRDISIVCDERVHGSNLKVSNLMNLLPRAKHETLVIADSDMRVPPDYLRRVTAPLAKPGVGLVTCLYRGQAVRGFWSRLGALFVNEWFAPSVSVASLFGPTFFAFGATLALRRSTLDALGGLPAIVDHLADDYRLGQLTRELGRRIVLSDCEVTSDVVENNLPDLVAHELRWLRTIRAVQPFGYFGLGVTFTLPAATIGCALAGLGLFSASLAAIAIATRALLHWQTTRGRVANIGLILLRDCLSLVLWTLALNTRRVNWRGQTLTISADGSALLVSGTAP